MAFNPDRISVRTPHDPADLPAWIEERTTRNFFVGFDVGQSVDPSALAVVERARLLDVRPGAVYFGEKHPLGGEVRDLPWRTEYRLRHLERLPLKMDYVAQARHVRQLLDTAPLRENVRLYVDATGVGRPVCDMLRKQGLSFIGITITAGDGQTISGYDWKVSKLVLVSGLQAKLHSAELKIAAGLPEAQALTDELQDFRISYSDAGNARFGAREGRHDDLVLAVAIAIFGAEQWARNRVSFGYVHGMY